PGSRRRLAAAARRASARPGCGRLYRSCRSGRNGETMRTDFAGHSAPRTTLNTESSATLPIGSRRTARWRRGGRTCVTPPRPCRSGPDAVVARLVGHRASLRVVGREAPRCRRAFVASELNKKGGPDWLGARPARWEEVTKASERAQEVQQILLVGGRQQIE